MDFDLAAQRFIQLEKLRQSQQLSEADYAAQLGAVRVTDPQGRTWMLQAYTGAWYVWDGAQWQAAAPPGHAAQVTAPQRVPPQPAPAPAPAPMQPAQAYAPTPPMQQGYAPVQPQTGYGQAQGMGYVSPQAVSPILVAQRKRLGCFSITLSMLLWTGLLAAAAWAVDAFWQQTPTWAYYAVGAVALGTLVLWIRRLTRHGRTARKLAQGVAR